MGWAEVGDSVACVDDFCDAGEPACDGEVLATCDTYGGGYTAPSTDRSATGQVCAGTTCEDSVEDTVGSTEANAAYTDRLIANRFYVSNTCKLSEIRQYFSVTGTLQATWVVYEGDSSRLELPRARDSVTFLHARG
jgi:hypothetical protein